MAITNGYCTLNELKAALRITDSLDDTLLENAIEAASRRIDNECSRRFYADQAATARVYASDRHDMLFVDDVSSTTGLVVKIDDDGDGTFETTLTLNVDYQIEPLNNLAQGKPVLLFRALDTLFPVASNKRALVEVTAAWGWPSVPDAIREATVLLASRQFKRLDSPLGVAGFGDLGAIVVRRIDPDVAALIEAYKHMVVA
jgi:hypothetical protein